VGSALRADPQAPVAHTSERHHDRDGVNAAQTGYVIHWMTYPAGTGSRRRHVCHLINDKHVRPRNSFQHAVVQEWIVGRAGPRGPAERVILRRITARPMVAPTFRADSIESRHFNGHVSVTASIEESHPCECRRRAPCLRVDRMSHPTAGTKQRVRPMGCAAAAGRRLRRESRPTRRSRFCASR
jgi:hypothetical protein